MFKSPSLVKHSYFLELVPTQYVTWGGSKVVHTHQYQVTNFTEVLVNDENLGVLPGMRN